MSEQWKPVVGYEDSHEVSDEGRVRSLDRYVAPSRGNTPRLHRGRVLHPSANGQWGHLRLALKSAGISRYRAVHRLVLEAFIGPCPSGMEACHKDGNPANNALSNLRWGTKASNFADMVEHARSRLAPEDAQVIEQLRAAGIDPLEIAARFNLSRPIVIGLTQHI